MTLGLGRSSAFNAAPPSSCSCIRCPFNGNTPTPHMGEKILPQFLGASFQLKFLKTLLSLLLFLPNNWRKIHTYMYIHAREMYPCCGRKITPHAPVQHPHCTTPQYVSTVPQNWDCRCFGQLATLTWGVLVDGLGLDAPPSHLHAWGCKGHALSASMMELSNSHWTLKGRKWGTDPWRIAIPPPNWCDAGTTVYTKEARSMPSLGAHFFHCTRCFGSSKRGALDFFFFKRKRHWSWLEDTPLIGSVSPSFGPF